MAKKTYPATKALEHYDADFFNWTMGKLGDCFDFWIQDIDGLVRDRKGNILLLEIKRRDYTPKPYQERNMALLDEIIKAGIDQLGGQVQITVNGKKETHTIHYHGFKLLQLSGETFNDSNFTVDGKPINAEDLVKLLRFENLTNYTG